MYGLILILLGGINLYYAIKFLNDPKFSKNYIQKSSKALIWRKLFGEEKAIKITRTIFAPIGIVLGTIFSVSGLYILLN